MSGAPLPINEAQRLGALYACGILDTGPERVFDALVALAARLTQAPIALLSLVDQSRQWFKARVGLAVQETPREHSFCAHAILQPTPFIIGDAARDARFKDNPLVTGSPQMRFYAGFPLELSDGARLGTLCVIETRPRTLSEQERWALAALAEQASAQLELRRTVQALRHAHAHQGRDADVALEARAQEIFRIGQVLHKRIAEELFKAASDIKSLIPEGSTRPGKLREALLDAGDRVAAIGLNARSLATHLRDFSLLKSGWLAMLRVDIEQLQQEHGARIALEEGVDPDRLLGYAAAHRLSECVHAALSSVIGLYGASHLSIALTQQGSMLAVCIRHDGREASGAVSNLHPAARLRALASELGAELTGSRVGERNELRISVALSSPPSPLAH